MNLERIDAENARVVSGSRILGTLHWTDSFWCARTPVSGYVPIREADSIEDLPMAYALAVANSIFATPQAMTLDFEVDPPTFVGSSPGELACWLYVAWKQVDAEKAPKAMADWTPKDFQAANTIYRRVRRKYGDSPPDKRDELRALS